MHGAKHTIRSDNGPEFIAKAFANFCQSVDIQHVPIQKGKPTQNTFIERFNKTYREDVLDATIFENLEQVRELTEKWMNDFDNFFGLHR